MRISHIIKTNAAILAAMLIAGCSKSPSEQPRRVTTPPKMTDLGAVELVAQTPKQFSLGAGRSCTITGRQLPDGISVKLVVLATNADGAVVRSQSEITTLPGRQCAISIGDVMIGLTPTLKTE
jgi:PBP1b-binding outer membrane lipoprotein LpoB